jgi:hypothetical protein
MRKFFSLVAAVLFTGSMFAAEITIVPSDIPAAENTEISAEVSGISLELTTGTVTEEQIRIFKNQTLTLSAGGAAITKIVFTCTAKGEAKYGPGCFAAQDGYSFEADGNTGTWEGSAESVEFTAESNQVRATQIVVTIDGAVTAYYVAGSMNGWGANEAYRLTPSNGGEFKGEFNFAANDEFKVIGVEGETTTWYPDGMGNNFQITQDGTYKIFFRPEGGQPEPEWYAGYFKVIMKEEPVAVEVNISEGLNYLDAVAEEGWWQIYGGNDQYVVSVSNVETEQAEGTYTIADLDPDYTYLGIINGADTAYVSFTDGSVTLSINAETGDVTVAGTLVGDDGNTYKLNLVFTTPKPESTVTVNIADGELDETYAEYGLYTVYGEGENNIGVQLAIWADNGFQGDFTEADLDNTYVGSAVFEGDEEIEIYSAEITVTPGDGGDDYLIEASLLCFNNKLYKVTMIIPGSGQGIEETLAEGKAVKVLRDGIVVIEKADKSFNTIGQRIR